jgi:hypothetical protein
VWAALGLNRRQLHDQMFGCFIASAVAQQPCTGNFVGNTFTSRGGWYVLSKSQGSSLPCCFASLRRLVSVRWIPSVATQFNFGWAVLSSSGKQDSRYPPDFRLGSWAWPPLALWCLHRGSFGRGIHVCSLNTVLSGAVQRVQASQVSEEFPSFFGRT